MAATCSADIAERARDARRLLHRCRLCVRRCGADRLGGERGYCGLDGGAYVFRDVLHFGVELELIPAHALYLAGCNMRCVFCTSADWNVHPLAARRWRTPSLRRRVEARRREGAKTLLLVGGEPTLSTPAVLQLLTALPDRPTVVWDSNMLMSCEARELLEGAVDVYVADLKFGNDRCAAQVAGVPAYVEAVTDNLLWAERTAGLIVRHLLLPGHLACCFTPVLKWLCSAVRAPRLSLRREYMPPAGLPERSALARYVTDRESERALAAAAQMGIELVP